MAMVVSNRISILLLVLKKLMHFNIKLADSLSLLLLIYPYYMREEEKREEERKGEESKREEESHLQS